MTFFLKYNFYTIRNCLNRNTRVNVQGQYGSNVRSCTRFCALRDGLLKAFALFHIETSCFLVTITWTNGSLDAHIPTNTHHNYHVSRLQNPTVSLFLPVIHVSWTFARFETGMHFICCKMFAYKPKQVSTSAKALLPHPFFLASMWQKISYNINSNRRPCTFRWRTHFLTPRIELFLLLQKIVFFNFVATCQLALSMYISEEYRNLAMPSK